MFDTSHTIEQHVAAAINLCSLPSIEGANFTYDTAKHSNMSFEQMGFDSLTCMEFCISLHCSTGIELSIEMMLQLSTPKAVINFARSSHD